MAIGIIALAFGVLGVLSNVLGAVGPFVSRALMAGSRGAQNEMFAVQEKYMLWTVVQCTVGALLSAFLGMGGVLLLRRRPASRGLLLIWAGLKAAFVVVATAGALMIQHEQLVAMQSSPSGVGNPAFAGPMILAMAIFGGVFALAWGWALPAFILVWFNRATIDAEVKLWE